MGRNILYLLVLSLALSCKKDPPVKDQPVELEGEKKKPVKN
jgi:hypothetical protein